MLSSVSSSLQEETMTLTPSGSPLCDHNCFDSRQQWHCVTLFLGGREQMSTHTR